MRQRPSHNARRGGQLARPLLAFPVLLALTIAATVFISPASLGLGGVGSTATATATSAAPTGGPLALLATADVEARVPFGAPSEAQRHARQKCLPLDRDPSSLDTPRLYREAELQMAEMRRYSSVQGRFLEELDGRSGGAGDDVGSADSAHWVGSEMATLRGRWRALGPGNIGGRTRTLVLDRRDPHVMYAGGVSGGVWKTTNGGDAWRAVGDGLENLAINSMAMHPTDPDTIYVGTGEGYFREDVRGTGLPLRGGGVFATSNGGADWALLASTDNANFHFVNDLVFSPRSGRRLYAATRTGVWRTKNAGRTWKQILDVDVQGGCLDLAIRSDVPGDALFVSCGTFEQATVYRSVNTIGAASFESVLSISGMGRTSIAIAPSAQDTIYAIAADNRPGPYEQALHGVYRSTSGGDAGSWAATLVGGNLNNASSLILHNAVNAIFAQCNPDFGSAFIQMGWYVNRIVVDPTNPNSVWAAGVDWFRSDDGGRNWGVASYWWAEGQTA